VCRGPSALAIGPINRSIEEEHCVQVLVRDNNVDQALKVLKKKMQREGVFREMKLRGHYEKPSERRVWEKAEAIRRARKLARKKLQREGLLPMKPRVTPGGVGRGGPRARLAFEFRMTASDTRDSALLRESGADSTSIVTIHGK
jgi:small subunit ribosomal protein S21